MPPNFPPLAALLRMRREGERLAGNGIAELEYPVEVELRVSTTSDTGELRTAAIATHQRAVIAAFDKKGAETYTSIPGLVVISAAVLTKDAARAELDEFSDISFARLAVAFRIVEART